MTDVEAQVEEGVGHPNQALVTISGQRLRDLVHMLSKSVEILQSSIELEDRTIASHPQPNSNLSSFDTRPDETIVTSRETHSKTKTQLPSEGKGRARVALASPEEITARKTKIHNAFDGQSIRFLTVEDVGKDFNFDVWRALQFLDWRVYSSLYTVAQYEPYVFSAGEKDAPAIIRYFLSNPDLQIQFLKEMYYGLSHWWWGNGRMYDWNSPSSASINRGVLDMAPWIALIGMRLPQYINKKEQMDIDKDIRRLRILTVLLDLPWLHSHDLSERDDQANKGVFWGDFLTVGQVLDQCYRQGILVEPESQDWNEIKENVIELKRAISLVNIWRFFERYEHQLGDTANEVRKMKISTFFSTLFSNEDCSLEQPRSAHVSFRCAEMSLEVLRKVGKLKFEWTEFIDEHLTLDLEEFTLRIFWFGFSAMANPIFHIGCHEIASITYTYCHVGDPSQSRIFAELSDTYSILFRSHKNTYDSNLHEYGLLPTPQWLRLCYGDEKGDLPRSESSKNMSYFTRGKLPYVSDMKYHLADIANPLPSAQNFDKYAIWGDRLRILKAYMDGQKPGGIRGLWADKRDSLQWYTFWAVIIVGGVSVLLSFFGLIVSITQTVGTFKGINH